eukprot:CAMPEP_0178918518 /NCGR_PEP_ID=MMETSP0786-20121207/13872_1 /TAXON_ID=186022 /ORGANISM="Thalassionema frauenfeldii, Strain CCMP 1798" /LENGTH=263 /DNA_ID=CAMNT_0020592239 /DNA_START=161 /DNA_END=952 /DNA_ORIENTATION=-
MTSSSFSESSTTQHPCAVVANPPCTKDAKAVIFDIDGTLANSWRLGYDATVVVLQKNDLGHVPINEEIYHQTCVYPTPERLARTAGLQPGDDNFEEMGETLGAQFDEYYVQLVSLATCEFYDGIASMLSNLPSTVQLGALTNACVAYGYAVLKVNTDETSNSLKYDRFGSIHGADSVPAAKPNPDGLLVSAKELNVEPKDCIYVGDAIGDGKAARAAGMMSIGVTWGSNSEDKLRDAQVFDYICRTRDELQELLPQASTNNES